MKKEKTIYDLELHESLRVDTAMVCVRVSGGWIYKFYNPDKGYTDISFVPYNNEFQDPIKLDVPKHKRRRKNTA